MAKEVTAYLADPHTFTHCKPHG